MQTQISRRELGSFFIIDRLNSPTSPSYFYIWIQQRGATLTAQTGLGIAAPLVHLPSKLHLDTWLRRNQVLEEFLY